MRRYSIGKKSDREPQDFLLLKYIASDLCMVMIKPLPVPAKIITMTLQWAILVSSVVRTSLIAITMFVGPHSLTKSDSTPCLSDLS